MNDFVATQGEKENGAQSTLNCAEKVNHVDQGQNLSRHLTGVSGEIPEKEVVTANRHLDPCEQELGEGKEMDCLSTLS